MQTMTHESAGSRLSPHTRLLGELVVEGRAAQKR